MCLITCDMYAEKEKRHVHIPRKKKCAAIRSLLRVEKLMAAFDCTNSTARGMREREGKKEEDGRKKKLDGKRGRELS